MEGKTIHNKNNNKIAIETGIIYGLNRGPKKQYVGVD